MNDQDKTKEELLKELHELKQEYDFLKSSYDKNVTERKKVDEVQLKIYLAVKNSREVIFLTDKEGIITLINPEFTKMYGYTAEEVIGKTTPRILKSGISTREQTKQLWKALLNKKSIPTSQYINKCKGGELIDVEGSADPIIDDNGDIIGFLGIQRDITERKESEKALKESEQRLHELNATKDKFFSIIAHDLRAPFNSLIGFSEILVKEIQNKNFDNVDEYANIIHDISNQSFSLLNNLLDWSMNQTGKFTFNPEKICITKLSNNLIDYFNNLALHKNITITSIIKPDLEVFADRNMLTTIVRNLISNAIKYTSKGGEIEVLGTADINETKVSIMDTGIGIEAEDLEKLFKIEETISTRGTDNEKGTGLGLILCKDFIEKHNGKIWVESEVGKGSTFSFTIPLD